MEETFTIQLQEDGRRLKDLATTGWGFWVFFGGFDWRLKKKTIDLVGGFLVGGGGLSCQNFGFDANKKTTSWWLNQPNLKNMSQIGSFPQVGVQILNLWNHHQDKGCKFCKLR